MSEGIDENFWKTKSLTEMNTQEWEALCDNCARCCLLKLEDIDSGIVYYTNVSCKLLDKDKCECTRYDERTVLVPDCVKLTPNEINDLHWMPSTCAYRLLSEGKDLPEWHPLVSGSPDSVNESGAAIGSFAIDEEDIKDDDLQDHIIELR